MCFWKIFDFCLQILSSFVSVSDNSMGITRYVIKFIDLHIYAIAGLRRHKNSETYYNLILCSRPWEILDNGYRLLVCPWRGECTERKSWGENILVLFLLLLHVAFLSLMLFKNDNSQVIMFKVINITFIIF